MSGPPKKMTTEINMKTDETVTNNIRTGYHQPRAAMEIETFFLKDRFQHECTHERRRQNLDTKNTLSAAPSGCD